MLSVQSGSIHVRWDSAVLAHFLLKEKLQQMGILGCVFCIVGSVLIVIHAPQEHALNSVQEIWDLATQPCSFSFSFLHFYSCNIKFISAL